VAIYCRVSSDDQDCERQECDLKAFAERAGHEVVVCSSPSSAGGAAARRSSSRLSTTSTPGV
jgi:DNA invertase Pin-like site-specific DNA recombinase